MIAGKKCGLCYAKQKREKQLAEQKIKQRKKQRGDYEKQLDLRLEKMIRKKEELEKKIAKEIDTMERRVRTTGGQTALRGDSGIIVRPEMHPVHIHTNRSTDKTSSSSEDVSSTRTESTTVVQPVMSSSTAPQLQTPTTIVQSSINSDMSPPILIREQDISSFSQTEHTQQKQPQLVSLHTPERQLLSLNTTPERYSEFTTHNGAELGIYEDQQPQLVSLHTPQRQLVSLNTTPERYSEFTTHNGAELGISEDQLLIPESLSALRTLNIQNLPSGTSRVLIGQTSTSTGKEQRKSGQTSTSTGKKHRRNKIRRRNIDTADKPLTCELYPACHSRFIKPQYAHDHLFRYHKLRKCAGCNMLISPDHCKTFTTGQKQTLCYTCIAKTVQTHVVLERVHDTNMDNKSRGHRKEKRQNVNILQNVQKKQHTEVIHDEDCV
jgi:hypothetical protein